MKVNERLGMTYADFESSDADSCEVEDLVYAGTVRQNKWLWPIDWLIDSITQKIQKSLENSQLITRHWKKENMLEEITSGDPKKVENICIFLVNVLRWEK